MLKLVDIEVEPKLNKFIRKITLFKSIGKIDFTQKILPSGYSYLSYNINNVPRFRTGKNYVDTESRLQIAGPKTKSNIYVEHKGSIVQILIEFTATGFYRLFNQSPSKFANSLASYSTINSSHIIELLSKLKFENNENLCVSIIQDHLLKIAKSASTIDKRIHNTVLEMEKHEGIITVTDALKYANLGERHFNRLFRIVVGCSPKLFLKTLQLHYIISNIAKIDNSKMLDIAYKSGFYDQAHFNKSFKKFVNMSPSKFIHSKEHISFQYFKK